MAASNTVTWFPQLAHTVSSKVSRVRTGAGPTFRQVGSDAMSQRSPVAMAREKVTRHKSKEKAGILQDRECYFSAGDVATFVMFPSPPLRRPAKKHS